MKRTIFAIPFLAAAAVVLHLHAIDPTVMLMKPRGYEPTAMQMYTLSYPGWVYPVDVSTGDAYPTGVTVVAWLKASGDPYANTTWIPSGGLFAMFTTKCGFSTAEGGHNTYSNLLNVAYADVLPLDANGQWAQANALPSTYDRDGMPTQSNDVWANGCYVVNVQTDTDLTLTIGGVEKNISASDEKQVFNINGLTADRSVSVLADDPSAVVHLGIAENPLVEFIDGGAATGINGGGSKGDPTGFTGLCIEEYKMLAFRASVNTNLTCNTELSMHACDEDYMYGLVSNIVQKGRKEGPYFGRDSRIRFTLGRLGIDDAVKSNMLMHVYGLKVFSSWLTDAQISTIRDIDVKAMQAKGIEFPRLAPDYWYLAYTVDRTNEVVESSTALNDTSGALGVTGTTSYDYTYTATYSLTNGVASTNMIDIGDVTLSCVGGTVRGNKIDFTAAGTYTVQATDPVGNVRTNRTVISGTSSSTSVYVAYTNDAAGTVQKRANDAVVEACLAATNPAWSGTYTPWSSTIPYKMYKARRIPCQPQWASISAQGHRGGVHPLSAHVVASARHYGWTVGCQQRYVSADETVTGTVTTVSEEWQTLTGPWLGLSEWAVTNGFSAAAVAAANIEDIIVSRVADGEVPEPCRPYFMTARTCTNTFGRAGVLGWGTAQGFIGWGLPVLLYDPRGNRMSKWLSPGAFPFAWNKRYSYVTDYDLSQLVRQDIAERALAVSAEWQWPIPYGGDSGLPIYVEIDGKFVLVSHYKSTSAGPSYVDGFAIIKAYVEWQGDTIKEYE